MADSPPLLLSEGGPIAENTLNDERGNTAQAANNTAKFANRTTWKKGMRSPNPKGRPRKGDTMTDWIARVGNYKEMQSPDGRLMTFKEALAKAAFINGVKGNYPYFREIMDRLDGPTAAKVEMHLRREAEGEEKTVRESMQAILDAVADDPAKRREVMELQREYFKIEGVLASLSAPTKAVNPQRTSEAYEDA